MRVLVSGSSGLIGRALLPQLVQAGHHVVRLVRRVPESVEGSIVWDPGAGQVETKAMSGFDGVIHLAGENIVGRWTPSKKAAIRDSRVRDTHLLAKTLAVLPSRPAVLICASAIGYYGERGNELVDESSVPGTGFLSEVCAAWEAACAPAVEAGIRVVNLRIGVVLSPAGGALAKMLVPFRLGLGGIMGSGKQYWSWISLPDVLGAIQHVLATPTLSGPVNAVAPEAIPNADFTKALGQVLRRPTIFPVPGFGARLLMGEMADALLLSSTRVKPTQLLQSRYVYTHPRVSEALQQLLQ